MVESASASNAVKLSNYTGPYSGRTKVLLVDDTKCIYLYSQQGAESKEKKKKEIPC